MPFGEPAVRWSSNCGVSILVHSKATNGTTESAIMNELRDMKNNFRG